MAVSPTYIRTLRGDPECIEALATLAENATAYPSGRFTPPLRRKSPDEKSARLLAAVIRCGRKSRSGSGTKITRIDVDNGEATSSFTGVESLIASTFARSVLRASNSGMLIVASDSGRGVLDIFLSSIGPSLLSMGYSIVPCGNAGKILFLKIAKGGRTWTLTTMEAASGCPTSVGVSLAEQSTGHTLSSGTRARALYSALNAVCGWLQREFGVAMRPTVGMTAMLCARRHLPAELQKWRPPPLLVAMERAGRGYRGGLVFARRYRGPTWRIDVNRQYTAALRTPLPLRVAFGRYKDEKTTPHGVFVCRVQLSDTLPYPLGVWDSGSQAFRPATVGRGSYVCILHTSEFPGLVAAGAQIEAGWGYVFTATFNLGAYADHLQAILYAKGKDSPEGRLAKPLGNYVYGKFAQRPDRVELLYSVENPGKEWYPYWDDLGRPWEEVWERNVTRHTSSQHIDIAATITGAARSQTASMWAWLSGAGFMIVRCHTDSLTMDMDPSDVISLSSLDVGSWRLESVDRETLIVGGNAFFDADGAHIAGVSEPTYEMIERLYDGQVVHVAQNVRAPRRGMQTGRRSVDRQYRSKAT